MHKKIGDPVKKGESLVSVYTNTGLKDDYRQEILAAYHFTSDYVEKPVLIDEILKQEKWNII